MERINSNTYSRFNATTGETDLFVKVTNYLDGTVMNDSKWDGVNYIKVGFEYFKRVNPAEAIESAPSFSDDTFDI